MRWRREGRRAGGRERGAGEGVMRRRREQGAEASAMGVARGNALNDEPARQAFLALPDTAIIADVHWHVLDFNRTAPFDKLRKGQALTRYMPDCPSLPDDEWRFGPQVFRRTVAPVLENGEHMGYTLYLADITELSELVQDRLRRSAELEELTAAQIRANAELEECARRAEELAARSERLRIARAIHDDSGHVITELHAISQMCLQLKESDPARCRALLNEGLHLCADARAKQRRAAPETIAELLSEFSRESLFPVETEMRGSAAYPLNDATLNVIAAMCKEAYHNALSHSLAEHLFIVADLQPGKVVVSIADDGAFRGAFTPGFGLTTMAENVRATGGRIEFRAVEGEGFGITAQWEMAQREAAQREAVQREVAQREAVQREVPDHG